ncbi:hypothetical protein STEG23_004474, partial [Scotinomys teguina]
GDFVRCSGKRMSQKPSMSLILNYESVVTGTTANLPRPVQSGAAQITDFHMISGDSTVMTDAVHTYFVLFIVKS